MKTYKEALYAIAEESAKVRKAQYLNGAMVARGLGSHGVAATLSFIYDKDFKEIRDEFEDLEFELYEELKFK